MNRIKDKLHIKYKLNNEFIVVVLIAISIAIIDAVLYMVFPAKMKLLLIVAVVMAFVALKYLLAAKTTYIILEETYIKIREYGPLNPVYKLVYYKQIESAVLIGQTLTLYLNTNKDIDIELCDMSPKRAVQLTGNFQKQGIHIERPGDKILMTS